MTQYLKKFGLTIDLIKSTTCNQPFVFRPSKRYVSTSLVELPVLVTRLDGKEDVLVIQTYLVDEKVLFLYGKQTLESWNFKIDSREKILEIQTKSNQDCSRKLIKMMDTIDGHYGTILETRKKEGLNLLFIEYGFGVLFVEDKKNDLCSFKSIR